MKMHTCYLNVPSLLLFSKTDPISNDVMNYTMSSKWEKKGVPVSIFYFTINYKAYFIEMINN